MSEQVAEKPFGTGEEEEFESMLLAHPDRFPITELNADARVAVPIGRQMTIADVGPLDLLFLDDTGTLYVVECKLVQNPQQRREVVAQVLEYGSRIQARWTVQDVLTQAKKHAEQHRISKGLVGLFERACTMAGIEERINHQALVKRIERKCKEPTLVVAANRFEERALVLVNHLRQYRVPIACVEVRRYGIGRHELVCGFVKAAGLLRTLSSSQRQQLNEVEWQASVTEQPLAGIRQSFLDWARHLAAEGVCRVRFGTTALMLDVRDKRDKDVKVLEVDERAWFHLRGFQALGFKDSQVQDLRADIEKLTGPLPADSKEYPSVDLKIFKDEPKRRTVQSILAAAMEEAGRQQLR
jgi:hypothetical protein